MGMPRESRLQENGETEFDADSSTTVPLDAFRNGEPGQRVYGHLVVGTRPRSYRLLARIGSGDP